MKRTTQELPRLPVQDYSTALRTAISWLGTRYVLAVPVKARTIDHSVPRYFGERRHWPERLNDKNQAAAND
jgi:hypothetical protein